MKRNLPFIWLLCLVLAAMHLLFLAAYQVSSGFFLFGGGLLACYSLPFALLWMVNIPRDASLLRLVVLALFFLIFIVSLSMPLCRFRPGYRPEALESLIYLFVPLIESMVVSPFLVIGRMPAAMNKEHP